MAVNLEINTEALTTEKGPSLFDCAEQVGIKVPTSCYKQGICRECIVEVTEGMERDGQVLLGPREGWVVWGKQPLVGRVHVFTERSRLF